MHLARRPLPAACGRAFRAGYSVQARSWHSRRRLQYPLRSCQMLAAAASRPRCGHPFRLRPAPSRPANQDRLRPRALPARTAGASRRPPHPAGRAGGPAAPRSPRARGTASADRAAPVRRSLRRRKAGGSRPRGCRAAAPATEEPPRARTQPAWRAPRPCAPARSRCPRRQRVDCALGEVLRCRAHVGRSSRCRRGRPGAAKQRE
mmetsp:Transcript_63528/g.174415  ORF Transcript_63528/g.174415 Transcript_63528/m.174415 type:complete len:205 (-) Transcript_63528:342-956(-)